MATVITKWMTMMMMIQTNLLISIHGQQVPCLFLFGDSLFDNGNNNVLITDAKVNHPPYGIDYPGALPSGRFTNGLNIPDFLAQLLGFNSSIPPFVKTRGTAILKGLNYASGGSGILDSSGIHLGGRFSMNMQLHKHLGTVSQIPGLLGYNKTETAAAKDYLGKCLYVVNIGNNDYINNYYLPRSPSRDAFSPHRFADILIRTFSLQLRILYELGSRKVAVFGLGVIGCVPQELSLYPTNGSPCVEEINNAVDLFDSRLVSLINRLNTILPGAQFTYINTTSIALGDPSLVDVKVINSPCCEVEEKIGQCASNGGVCSNRDEYMFFDNFHPTQISCKVTASRSYTALLPTDAYPVDIRTLVQS